MGGKEVNMKNEDWIDKAAEEFADKEYMTNQYERDALYKGYYHGMKDALSKQEKDADTVISGWVARDKNGDLFMYSTKPEWDRLTGMWYGERALITPSNDLFPDLTWESDPIEVELIIKRKKNGNNSTDNRI